MYPQESGVVWVLYQYVVHFRDLGGKMTDDGVNRDYDCKGATLQVTAPGIDNLADRGFNDRVSSFSWFLR